MEVGPEIRRPEKLCGRYEGGARKELNSLTSARKAGSKRPRLANSGTPSYFQGYGIQFFGPKEYYEGEWCNNQRSGWGRMYYNNGDIYEGQWQNDKPEGEGMLRLSECPAPMKPRPNAS